MAKAQNPATALGRSVPGAIPGQQSLRTMLTDWIGPDRKTPVHEAREKGNENVDQAESYQPRSNSRSNARACH